jgi:hypothetical protein
VTPADYLNTAIKPALAKLPRTMQSLDAEMLILAIALQESDLRHRRQIGGPARGYPQFELIGVRGVIEHPASMRHATALCAVLDVPTAPETIYEAIAWHDVLSAGFSRLALWRDPQPLPTESEPDKAWAYYLRCWGPGKPKPEKWADNWNRAWGAL